MAPQMWWYELRNALGAGERQGRLNTRDARATLEDLPPTGGGESPPGTDAARSAAGEGCGEGSPSPGKTVGRIALDPDHDERVLLDLARPCRLSACDTAYPEFARHRRLRLASPDRLRDVVTYCGVAPLDGRRSTPSEDA